MEAHATSIPAKTIAAIVAAITTLAMLGITAQADAAKVTKGPAGLKFYKLRRSCRKSTAP